MFGDLAGWLAAAAVCAVCLMNFDTLKQAAAGAMGLPDQETRAAEAAAQAAAKKAEGGNGTVEIPASGNGHYHAEVEINGRDVPVLVDTGATTVALTYDDAENAGIFLKDSDFTHTVSTANGTARVAPVMLDRISIGDITVRNVQGMVTERGRLETTLLGMSFLSRLSRVDMRSGILVLQD